MLKTLLLAIAILRGTTPTETQTSIAIAIADAVESTGVDGLLLTSLAWHESHFDPSAMSTANGSWSAFQLAPRYSRDVINRCAIYPELCQRFTALHAAQALQGFIRQCRGIGPGVRAYRFGKCGQPRPRDLAVVATRNRLARSLRPAI